jgi:hypothetical protein
VSSYSKVDQRTNVPALYVGDANNSFTNVTIIHPAGTGIWVGAYAGGTMLTNVNVKAPGGQCLLVKGPSLWSNVTCSDPSFAAPGTADAVTLDATAGRIDGLMVSGMNVLTYVSKPRHVIASSGENDIVGRISVARMPDVPVPFKLHDGLKRLQVIAPGNADHNRAPRVVRNPSRLHRIRRRSRPDIRLA